MYKAVTVWLTSVTAVLQRKLEARNSKHPYMVAEDDGQTVGHIQVTKEDQNELEGGVKGHFIKSSINQSHHIS